MFDIDYFIFTENDLSEQDKGIDEFEYLYHKKITEYLAELKNLRQVKKRESHGMSKSRLYYIWHGIKNRCCNENCDHYYNYGGRGITVCDEWKLSFINFYNWSIDNGYTDKLTIDRIDTNGPYSPDNCRWVDYTTQSYNKRNTIKVNIDGQLLTARELSQKTGINERITRERMKKGINNIEDFKEKPSKGYNKKLTYNGITKTYKEWENDLKLSHGTISSRLRNGWSVDEIINTPMGQQRVLNRTRLFLTYKGVTKTLIEWSKETGLSIRLLYNRFSKGWTAEKILTTPKRGKTD